MNIFSLFRSQPDHTTRENRANSCYGGNQCTSIPDEDDYGEDCVILNGVMLDRKKDAQLISDFMVWSAPMM